jgi:hypothetical protein
MGAPLAEDAEPLAKAASPLPETTSPLTTVRPNNFPPTLLKYPLKKENCPVKKLAKSTENGHKMVKNRG